MKNASQTLTAETFRQMAKDPAYRMPRLLTLAYNRALRFDPIEVACWLVDCLQNELDDRRLHSDDRARITKLQNVLLPFCN